MEPEELMDVLHGIARGMGIVDIAAAPASTWETDPMVSQRIGEGHRPRDLMPDAESVLVIGIPIQRTIVETAPSLYYNHLYSTVNTLLDQASERLALELNALGRRAVYVPRDGYRGIAGLRENREAYFSHRHAAYLAGMGTFGWNNMLLTERYGPRIRLSSVITDAVLPYGTRMDRDLCMRCGRCTRACPVSAVGDESYPGSITDKPACVENFAELAQRGISPCGRCIAACPVGADKGPGPTDAAVEAVRRYRRPNNNILYRIGEARVGVVKQGQRRRT